MIQQGEAAALTVHATHGQRVSVWVDLEDGTTRRDITQQENWNPPREVDGRMAARRASSCRPTSPLGITPSGRGAGRRGVDPVIVSPARLGMPEGISARREWGLATELYSVRSKGSWGIGDLTDLGDLACWAGAEHGAGYVLVNPLHAAEPVTPIEPSPYLPTSRRFTNPIYLRVERVTEYAHLRPSERAEVENLREEVQTWLTGQDVIDLERRVAGQAGGPVGAAPRAAQRRTRAGPQRVPSP